MADSFRPVFEALKQTADGLILANEGIKKMADAVLAAREEHEDLRETVHRLERLVIEQGHELRALRERLATIERLVRGGRAVPGAQAPPRRQFGSAR